MLPYCLSLFILSMTDRLRDNADVAHDLTGRQLEEEQLPQGISLPKNKNTGRDHD
jgi:hypothetical protein